MQTNSLYTALTYIEPCCHATVFLSSGSGNNSSSSSCYDNWKIPTVHDVIGVYIHTVGREALYLLLFKIRVFWSHQQHLSTSPLWRNNGSQSRVYSIAFILHSRFASTLLLLVLRLAQLTTVGASCLSSHHLYIVVVFSTTLLCYTTLCILLSIYYILLFRVHTRKVRRSFWC